MFKLHQIKGIKITIFYILPFTRYILSPKFYLLKEFRIFLLHVRLLFPSSFFHSWFFYKTFTIGILSSTLFPSYIESLQSSQYMICYLWFLDLYIIYFMRRIRNVFLQHWYVEHIMNCSQLRWSTIHPLSPNHLSHSNSPS